MSPEQRWWIEDEHKRMDAQYTRDIVRAVCQLLVIATLLASVWLMLYGGTW